MSFPAFAISDDAQDTPAATAPARSVTRTWLSAMQRVSELTSDPAKPLAAVLDDLGARHGDRAAILDERGTLGFEALAALSRRWFRWARGAGLGRGDVVALLAPNRAAYLAAWTGVSRTGATVALLNGQLPPEAVLHSLRTAAATCAILDQAFAGAMADALKGLDEPLPIHDLDDAVAAIDGSPLRADETTGAATLQDRALLIFTSGTTGWPKAANVGHARVMAWCGWFSGMTGATAEDRLYDCLPMHHSVGGVAAIGAALVSGASVVVRERFSASRFWADVSETGSTLFQYIGELCRYLLAAPPGPFDRAHGLRLACGNGMGGAVWEAFQARFAVPQVLEFYAATEGSFSLFNVEGRPGAVGRAPPFLQHRFPAAIVRRDAETGVLIRDADGRCVRCPPGEPGEAIGRIATGSDQPFARFEGYTSLSDSEAKVARDVFETGDAWFRTGDLMARDADGFFRFVDRLGDTFRWKGENVAAAEVADVAGRAPGAIAAAVWGVQLPGCEGRAGMAAVEVGEGFDLDAFARHVADRLPSYARPLLLRLTRGLAATSTFKLQTRGLADEGFDPAVVSDPLFLLEEGRYRPLDADLYGRLMAGALRL